MTDLKFDFDANDIVISNGDFLPTQICSMQNATLLFNKSAASLTQPQYGIGFEDFYPWLPQWAWGRVEVGAQRQIYSDGALIARVRIQSAGESGVAAATIEARYRE